MFCPPPTRTLLLSSFITPFDSVIWIKNWRLPPTQVPSLMVQPGEPSAPTSRRSAPKAGPSFGERAFFWCAPTCDFLPWAVIGGQFRRVAASYRWVTGSEAFRPNTLPLQQPLAGNQCLPTAECHSGSARKLLTGGRTGYKITGSGNGLRKGLLALCLVLCVISFGLL